MQTEFELLDALGVVLRPGQRVVFAVAGIDATGELTPGTIAKVALFRQRDGNLAERIRIRRDDGRRSTICWSKRILVLRQPTAAEELAISQAQPILSKRRRRPANHCGRITLARVRRLGGERRVREHHNRACEPEQQLCFSH